MATGLGGLAKWQHRHPPAGGNDTPTHAIKLIRLVFFSWEFIVLLQVL